MRLAFSLAGMGKLLEALAVWEASPSAAGGCSKESCKLPGEQRCSLLLILVVTQHCHMPWLVLNPREMSLFVLGFLWVLAL